MSLIKIFSPVLFSILTSILTAKKGSKVTEMDDTAIYTKNYENN